MEQAKPFDISKRLVWEAYQHVRARKGAAGVDEVTLEEYERNLKDNLYKLWNRMSSGSYFPAPVRLVEIAKKRASARDSDGPRPHCADGGQDGARASARPPLSS